jgi:cellulose synthase/poly-beta-1,6-N-acetylglucosamine synthase-like glycosyltransferase
LAAAAPARPAAPAAARPAAPAAAWVAPRRRAFAWWRAFLAGLEPATRRAARRTVVAACLLPLLAILAHQAPRLASDPLLLGYGMAVLAATIALLYIAFTRYDDPGERPPPDGPLPPVTCLVAVKDEVEEITRCVASILASDYPRLEVVVVDDGSTDGTSRVLAKLARRHRFRLLTLGENVGKKRALTLGVARATGELLVFTDSDCVLAPDAISRCVAAFAADPDLGAVSGHARALNADRNLLTRAQDVWYDGQFRVVKAAESSFASVTCVSGPLAAFRREAVWNYLPAWAADSFLGQPFRFSTDRQLTAYVLGQGWVGARLKRRHADSPFVSEVDYPARRWRVEYVRSARVWTNVPASWSALVRQQVRWKKSFLRNLCFTGLFAWRRGPGPAALYYGHALWVALTPLMAVRHLVWLPLHGRWPTTGLYLAGVLLKGGVWALAYKVDNPGCPRWVYRPVMSVVSSTVLSWLLVWSALSIRRGVWTRGTA